MSLLTNLISYWKLDESSGNAADSQGSETLTNNATITYSAGALNNAANLASASSQYFSRASNANLQTGDIDYTISCWIKLASKATAMMIITKSQAGGASASDYEFRYNTATDRLFYQHRDSGGGTPISVVANNYGNVPTGQWIFVVFWHDATTNKGYIQVNNGTPDEAAETGTPASSTIAFEIGSFNGGSGNFFNGSVDETGFWKRVLTAAERTGLYNAGTPLTFDQFGSFGAGAGFFFLSQ